MVDQVLATRIGDQTCTAEHGDSGCEQPVTGYHETNLL